MAVRTLKPPTLANIARHLEGLHCRTPRGETRWSVSSVQNLLAQAVAQGLLEDRPLPAPEGSSRARPPTQVAQIRRDGRLTRCQADEPSRSTPRSL